MKLVRVHDPTQRLTRTVARYLDLDAGRLACSAFSNRHYNTDLWDVLLGAMGKTVDLSANANRGSSYKLALTQSWLYGEGVRSVVIARAHRLGRLLFRMIDLAVLANLSVYFITTNTDITSGARERIADYGLDEIDAETFVADHPITGAAEPVVQPPYPRPPDAGIGLARPTAYESMSHQQFAAYDQQWRVGFEQSIGATGAADDDAIEEREIRALQRLITTAASAHDAVARVQGAQAGLLRSNGSLLRFTHRDKLVGVVAPRTDPAVLAFSVTGLRRFTHTSYPAAGALRLATGATADILALLAIGDIARDAGTVSLPDRVAPIPPELQRFLRAHLALRLLESGDEQRPLFLNNYFAPVSTNGMQRWLLMIAKHTGVPTAQEFGPPQTPTGRQWLHRAGLTITR